MQISIKEIQTKNTPFLGSLSFFEGTKDLPFEIKRIYYIYHVPKGSQRGGHAHKNLSQFLFCPYGQIRVILDNGFEKKEIVLDKPSKGLFVSNGIWRDLLWEKDNSVLCVAASNYYEESDYIRDYAEFKKFVKEGYWNE